MLNPSTLYVALNFLGALTFSLIFTVNQIYFVTTVGMSPLQLVLMGTILEASIFLFEIPTGIVADVKSRKLSIIVGYFVMGIGFIIEGMVPNVWVVALAQVIWGLGFTFTSGATEAWVSDEIGESKAGDAYLRGAQWGNLGGLLAIPMGVYLGSIQLNMPIILGGMAIIAVGFFLIVFMREEGYSPTARSQRSPWLQTRDTVQSARKLLRRQPLLINLLWIGFFFGLYSEGLDRLWTPHFLENFTFPFSEVLNVVAWFGIIRAIRLLMSIFATMCVRRRLDMNNVRAIGILSRVNSLLIIVALVGFGLSQSFWITLIFFLLIFVIRNLQYPLTTAWVNLKIDDPQVRATMLSVNSQVDAIGQITGGPIIGLVGDFSIRVALVASAFMLTPVLPLYARVMRAERKNGYSEDLT